MTQEEQPVLDIDEKKMYAALCYVGVLVLVPLLIKKEDPYINWHIRQGLVVLGLTVVSLLMLAWVEALGSLLFVVVMTANVIALVQALLGKKWKIPVIGSWADRFRV